MRYRWAALTKAQRDAVRKALARLTAPTHAAVRAAETPSDRVARLFIKAKALLAAHIAEIGSLPFKDVEVLSKSNGDEYAYTDSESP